MNRSEVDIYDMATGPTPTPRGAGRKSSAKQFSMPVDLTRSRRHGITMTVCAYCGAPYDQGLCRHNGDMPHPETSIDEPRRIRIGTGPMLANQTSNDTGWHKLDE